MSARERIEELRRRINNLENTQASLKNITNRTNSVLEITTEQTDDFSGVFVVKSKAIERLEKHLGIELVDVPDRKEYRKIKKAKK